MKNPMHKLRRFFVRTRTYKATAAPAATQTSHDEDDGSNRLSGAFLVVLFLHMIAVVGVFAFARIKESRIHTTPPEAPAAKTAAKPPAAKPPAAKVPAPATFPTLVAASLPQPASRELVKLSPSPHNTPIVKEGQSLAIPGAKQPQKITATSENKSAQTAAQKTAPADHKTGKTYTVRKGDTPLKIAREHGCSYDDLMKLNSVKDPKKIQTGQVLKLPVKNG